MARLDNQGIRIAKKNVSRWFVGAETRRFVPRTGGGIPVSGEEELAIRAGSEVFIAKGYDGLSLRLIVHAIIMIGAVTLIYALKARYPTLQNSFTDFIAYGVYAMNALAMFAAAWRWEKSVLDLREAIGFSLLERRPVSAQLFERAGPDVPDYYRIGAAAFLTSGAIMLWPMVDAATGVRERRPNSRSISTSCSARWPES